MPTPLSVISTVIMPSLMVIAMSAIVAWACRAQFDSASRVDVAGQVGVLAEADRPGKADAGGEAELRGVLGQQIDEPSLEPGGFLAAGLVELEDAGPGSWR